MVQTLVGRDARLDNSDSREQNDLLTNAKFQNHPFNAIDCLRLVEILHTCNSDSVHLVTKET